MTIEEILAEFEAQGLRMEPENDGESIDILNETMASLNERFEAVSAPDTI